MYGTKSIIASCLAKTASLEDDSAIGSAVTINVNVNAEEPAAPTETEMVSATPDLAEGEMDVAKAEEPVEQTGEALDELNGAKDGLEALKDTLVRSQTKGGLDPQAAVYMQGWYRSITDRIGEPADTLKMPGLESYGGTSTKIAGTQASLEEVDKRLAKVGNAIKEGFKTLMKHIKAFLAQVFNELTRVRVRAEKLLLVAEQVKDKESSGVIEAAAATILTQGGHLTAETIEESVKRATEGADYVYLRYLPKLATAVKEATKAIQDDTIDKYVAPHELAEVPSDLCHEICGGYKLVGNFVTPGSSTGVFTYLDIPNHEDHETLKIHPLTHAQIETILKRVISMASTFENKRELLADYEKECDALFAADPRKQKEGENKIEHVALTAGERVSRYLTSTRATLLVNRYSKFIYQVSRAAVTVCERSIGHHLASHGKPSESEHATTVPAHVAT